MYLALDVGGSAIKYGLLDENCKLLQKGKTSVRFDTPEGFAQGVREIYDRFGCGAQGVAVSYCGELDPSTGYAYSGGSLPYNTGVELRTLLQKALPVPVAIENDGNCAALAELHSGCLKNCQNAAVYVLGTGIASALVFNGKIYRGSNFSAGFASAMVINLREALDVGAVLSNVLTGINSTVYQPGNLLSMAIGYLGLTAPLASAKGMGQNDLDGEAFFTCLAAGDEDAERIFSTFCQALANHVFNTQCLLDVDAVAIGGGISQQPLLLERTAEYLNRNYERLKQMGLIVHPPRLVACHHQADANLIGALYHYLLENEKEEPR